MDGWTTGLIARFAGALALAVLAAQCGAGGDPDLDTPSATRASPAPSPTTAPTVDQRTKGIRDSIAAIESAEWEQIAERLVLQAVACAADDWPFPVCAPGESVGTERHLFPFVSCEPSFLRPEDLLHTLEPVSAARQPELEAAVATGPSNEPFPLGPYVLVFRTAPPAGVVLETGILAVLREDGRVVSIRTGCRGTPEQLLRSLPPNGPIPGLERIP